MRRVSLAVRSQAFAVAFAAMTPQRRGNATTTPADGGAGSGAADTPSAAGSAKERHGTADNGEEVGSNLNSVAGAETTAPPTEISASPSSSPPPPAPVVPLTNNEKMFLKTSSEDAYVMSHGVTPRSIADLHHQTAIGARINLERSVVASKYGGEAAEARARRESSDLSEIREENSIENIVNLVALKSSKVSTAIIAEAASSILRISTENSVPNSSPVAIMQHLAGDSDATSDPNGRWAITADEVIQYQRFLSVKRSLGRNTGTGEDDSAVRRIFGVMVKKNVPPTVAALCDLTLADISFPTAIQLLGAYHRLMGDDVPPPAEMLVRIMGLVTPGKYLEALQLYNKYYAEGYFDPVSSDAYGSGGGMASSGNAVSPAIHGHALQAVRYWWLATSGAGGESPPTLIATQIRAQVARIVKVIPFEKLRGDEGSYVLSAAIEMLAVSGDWPLAEVHLKRFATISANKTGGSDAILEEDLEGEEDSAAEKPSLLSGSGGANDKKSGGLRAQRRKAAEEAAAKIGRESRLLVHTATTLTNAMAAALNGKSPATFDFLRAQFDASGFKFSDCEHFTLNAFMGTLTKAKFTGVSFAWVERKLVADLVTGVDPQPSGAVESENQQQSDVDVSAIANPFAREVSANASRATLESLLRMLGGLAANINAIRIPGASEPSPLLWRACLDVYRAVQSLPITPYKSGIATRVQSYNAMLMTLLTCFRNFKAPVSAVESLGANIAATNRVDSVEFALFCAAILKVNAGLSGVGGSMATEACTVQFLRSPHHCLRMLTHTAAKAPQGFMPLQMAQCRRGVAAYLRAAVAKGEMGWAEAMDLLMCHPLVASQDPMPDPAVYLDIAVIASYAGAANQQQQQVYPNGLITRSGMPVVDGSDGAVAVHGAVRINDLVLYALAMAPKALVDTFMAAGGGGGGDRSGNDAAATHVKPSRKTNTGKGTASSSSSSSRESRALEDDGDAEDLYAAAGAASLSGTINSHLVEFIAAATHVPVNEAWQVFDNQRHRLKGHAMAFFEGASADDDCGDSTAATNAANGGGAGDAGSSKPPGHSSSSSTGGGWRWEIDASRTPIKDIFKAEAENYFDFSAAAVAARRRTKGSNAILSGASGNYSSLSSSSHSNAAASRGAKGTAAADGEKKDAEDKVRQKLRIRAAAASLLSAHDDLIAVSADIGAGASSSFASADAEVSDDDDEDDMASIDDLLLGDSVHGGDDDPTLMAVDGDNVHHKNSPLMDSSDDTLLEDRDDDTDDGDDNSDAVGAALSERQRRGVSRRLSSQQLVALLAEEQEGLAAEEEDARRDGGGASRRR